MTFSDNFCIFWLLYLDFQVSVYLCVSVRLASMCFFS